MLTLYFTCLLVGLVFAVLSFIFSGGFEADVGADVGADLDTGGDVSGGDVGVGEVSFPLFSPIVIATFITAFGGGGIIGLKLLPFMPMVSLATATGAGVGLAFLAGLVVMKLYKIAQESAITRSSGLVGHLAEVTETIPANGVGEISFSGQGGRLCGPARSEEKRDIKRHAMVTITRVIGGLYYVREHVDERLRNVPEGEEADQAKPDSA